jgi:hypothetical protein
VLRKNSPHTVCWNTWCVVLVGIRPSSFVHSTSVPNTGNNENTYTTFPYDLRPDNKKQIMLHCWYKCHLKLVYTKVTGYKLVNRLDSWQGQGPMLCSDCPWGPSKGEKGDPSCAKVKNAWSFSSAPAHSSLLLVCGKQTRWSCFLTSHKLLQWIL